MSCLASDWKELWLTEPLGAELAPLRRNTQHSLCQIILQFMSHFEQKSDVSSLHHWCSGKEGFPQGGCLNYERLSAVKTKSIFPLFSDGSVRGMKNAERWQCPEFLRVGQPLDMRDLQSPSATSTLYGRRLGMNFEMKFNSSIRGVQLFFNCIDLRASHHRIWIILDGVTKDIHWKKLFTWKCKFH